MTARTTARSVSTSCGDVLIHVTYTERGDRIRVISARRAERYEQDDYYRENSV